MGGPLHFASADVDSSVCYRSRIPYSCHSVVLEADSHHIQAAAIALVEGILGVGTLEVGVDSPGVCVHISDIVRSRDTLTYG